MLSPELPSNGLSADDTRDDIKENADRPVMAPFEERVAWAALFDAFQKLTMYPGPQPFVAIEPTKDMQNSAEDALQHTHSDNPLCFKP